MSEVGLEKVPARFIPEGLKPELPEALRCDCMCSSCAEDCHYSDYHCKHAKEDDREYGAYEAKGFCVRTGFMPTHSWRHGYSRWHT